MLHGFQTTLKREWLSWRELWQQGAVDSDDPSRLRRLKELAETNEDHMQALYPRAARNNIIPYFSLINSSLRPLSRMRREADYFDLSRGCNSI